MKQTLHDPLGWIDDALAELDDASLRRRLSTHEGQQGPRLRVCGREFVNFGSNDYLGLAADPRLLAAAQASAVEEGWGAGASPLVTGRAAAHGRLEQHLAAFEGTEAALLFPSGYAANVGAITALAGRGDAIYSDAKNHASLIDGCRLSGAEVHVYSHCDSRSLESLIDRGSGYRRRLIATESVFSMDGDLAPLAELSALAERYGAMLLVDEAHATGVFGQRGRGLAEALDVEHSIHIRVGTLSKALGSAGGFVCGKASLIDWLVNRARSYIFSTAAPPSLCAAGTAALAIVGDQADHRGELLSRARNLRQQLREDGWQTGASNSQIIPLVVGEAAEAVRLSRRLAERGFLVPAMRPPSVPAGESLLRISLSYAHTAAMLAQLRMELAELRPPRLA